MFLNRVCRIKLVKVVILILVPWIKINLKVDLKLARSFAVESISLQFSQVVKQVALGYPKINYVTVLKHLITVFSFNPFYCWTINPWSKREEKKTRTSCIVKNHSAKCGARFIFLGILVKTMITKSKYSFSLTKYIHAQCRCSSEPV